MKKDRVFNDVDQLISFFNKDTFSADIEEYASQFLNTSLVMSTTTKDLKVIMEYIGLQPPFIDSVCKTFERLSKNQAIKEAWLFLRYVCVEAAHPSDWVIKKAPVPKINSADINAFNLLSILIISDFQMAEHRQRQIGLKHTKFNLEHLKGYIENVYKQHQKIGIENYTWCLYLGALGLIHLHSLHFMHHRYSEPFIVFRHRISKKVSVLAKGNVTVRKDGQIDGTNKVFSPWFTTKYEETEHAYQGYLVLPEGAISDKWMSLPKNTYEIVLKPGDYTIDYHIPSNKEYTIESSKKAFEMANSFFKTHYPEYTYKAFWCLSWLSSPQIPFFIKKVESNIVKIHNQGYTLPATNGEESLFNFVFKKQVVNFDTETLDTSLKVGIHDFVQKSGLINCGVFIYLIDDLSAYGSAPYSDELTKKYFYDINYQFYNKSI